MDELEKTRESQSQVDKLSNSLVIRLAFIEYWIMLVIAAYGLLYDTYIAVGFTGFTFAVPALMFAVFCGWLNALIAYAVSLRISGNVDTSALSAALSAAVTPLIGCVLTYALGPSSILLVFVIPTGIGIVLCAIKSKRQRLLVQSNQAAIHDNSSQLSPGIRKTVWNTMIVFWILVIVGIWGNQPKCDIVPYFPFRGMYVEKVLYCYNPSTVLSRSDSNIFAVYQLNPFDMNKWLKVGDQPTAMDKSGSGLGNENSDCLDKTPNGLWLKGPITNPNYRKAIACPFAQKNIPDEALKLINWKSLLDSDSIYVRFERIEWGYEEKPWKHVNMATVWILDARTYRMYLASYQ